MVGRGYEEIIDDDNEEITFDNSLSEIIRVQNWRQTPIGKIRTVGNIKGIEWGFLILNGISIFIGLGFSIYRLSTSPGNSDFNVFSILVMVNLLFSVFYLVHGVFQEQPFEILMLIFTTFLLWFMLTVNYASSPYHVDIISQVRLISTTFLSLFIIALACYLSWNYLTVGNLIFKTVGSDPKMQKMCRTLFLSFTLLVFDAQAFLSCIILFIRGGLTHFTQEDIVVVVSGVLFTIIWLMIGYVAMRMENLRLTSLFILASIVQPLYVIYLLVQAIVSSKVQSPIITNSVYVASGSLTLVHFTLMATIGPVSFNYGKGLDESIYGKKYNVEEEETPIVQVNSEEDPLIQPGPSRIRNNEDYEEISPYP